MKAARTLATTLALSLTGCGLFVEGGPVRVASHASGTVEVHAIAEAGGAGGVQIVEQPAGQGFVVERGSAELLAGLGVVPAARASGGGGAVLRASAGGSGSLGAGADGVASAGGGTATWPVGAGPSGGSSATWSAGGSTRAGTGASAGTIWGTTTGTATGASAGTSWGTTTTTSTATGVSTGTSAGASRSASTGTSAGASRSASVSTGTSADTSGSASGGSLAAGSGGAFMEASATLEARAEVPREGVWGVDGRPTALTAIVDPGVQVDGVRVRLADLEALADAALPAAPSSRLATDGSIEAWAELEHEALARAGGETHVVVRVRAPEAAAVPRGRVRLHLVVDRSSSMQRSWDRVLAAARMLVRHLGADDELHVVAYGTDAVEAFPMGPVGDGRAALAALDRISVGGGTNIEAGLELAYRASARAEGDARGLVLLLSDGVPNHGAFEPAELGALVARARAGGCTTSVIGIGTEFDARLLRAIAREGRGGYYVSARIEALGHELLAELDAHARVAARQLSVRVALPDDVELVELAGGGAERVEGGVELSMPHLAAGEERSLVLRVRVPRATRARTLASISLRYRSGQSDHAFRASASLEVSFGARAILRSDGRAGAGVMDAALASALDVAGDAILAGDAGAAARALAGHAAELEGRIEHRRSPALQARARVLRRLSAAVGELLPGAGHPQRRQVALAFGGLAARFGR